MKILILLPPKAQKRARHAVIGGRAVAYKDKGQRLEEHKLGMLLYDHRPAKPYEGAVFLSLIAYLALPKSKPKWWKRAALAGEILPIVKPDLDNLVKHLKDCMTGIFYLDDKQVVQQQARKAYGETACWEIVIYTIGKQPPSDFEVHGESTY